MQYTAVYNGGGEGSRTPVRKAVNTGRYMFSLSFDLILLHAGRQAYRRTGTN